MMRVNEITARAVGKWDYLFESLGIEVGNGKHCPCPVCGGKDRFRFDDKDGRGTWICNQCGSGDGLELIKRCYNCDAKDASNRIVEYLNLNATGGSNKRLSTDLKSELKNNMRDKPVFEKVKYLLSKAVLWQSEYLTKKGLTFDLPLLDDGRIIAPMLNLNNEYTGAQFIYADGKKQLMKGSSKKGSFIIVTPLVKVPEMKSATEIIICEGLATGISMLGFQQRVIILSAIDAGNLIHVARAIRDVNPTAKIIIAGDNDIGADTNVGRDKAIESAEAVNGYYSIPNTDYKCDWDDYRQKHGIDNTLQSFNENLKKPIIETLTKTNTKKDLSSMNLSQMASSQRAELLSQCYDDNLAINMATDEIYHYQGNHWHVIPDKLLMRKLASLFIESGEPYNPLRISSAIDSLRLSLPIMGDSKRDLICFKNGVYDTVTKTFRQHNKSDWLLVSNNIDYYQAIENESLETHAPNFYKWLSHSANGDTVKMNAIKSALYMILANRYDWQLFLEVTGDGGSGKSVFTLIATLLSGKSNTVSGTMDALEKARERALLVGYSLIILPDQPKYVGSGAGLKAITGGDEVAIDPKNKHPYSCKIPSVVLVTNNEAMRFNERNGGISRRRVIFHFSKVVSEKERDPLLVNKVEKELPTVVRLLLDEFSDPLIAKERLHEYQKSDEARSIKRETDHLVDFCSYLNALDYPTGMLMGNLGIRAFNPKRYLYHAYTEYVNNTGLSNPLSLSTFGSTLNYAMKENGKHYIKKRMTAGIKTNLELNTETCKDWLPRAELDN